MNKQGICKQAASISNLSEDEICAAMDAVEEVIKSVLIHGESISWGDFFRAWMVEKRPAHHRTGAFLIKDTATKKTRFLMPTCKFGPGFGRLLKTIQFNSEDPNWKEEWYERVMEAMNAEKEKQKRIELQKITEKKHEPENPAWEQRDA